MEVEIQIFLSIVTALVTGIIGWLFYKLRKHVETNEANEQKHLKDIQQQEHAINEALRALCHDRILQVYKDFQNSGNMSAEDLEMTTHLYEAYHALGGNGAVTAIYESIKQALSVRTTIK